MLAASPSTANVAADVDDDAEHSNGIKSLGRDSNGVHSESRVEHHRRDASSRCESPKVVTEGEQSIPAARSLGPPTLLKVTPQEETATPIPIFIPPLAKRKSIPGEQNKRELDERRRLLLRQRRRCTSEIPE